MATKSKPKAVPFNGLSGLPHWSTTFTPAHLKPKPKRAKKKPAVKAVFTIEPTDCHKDMMGRTINQGDFVLAVQNNRPFPFVVVKLNKTTLTIKPAIKWRSRGGSTPKIRNYRREGWNLYIIPEEEVFMFTLAGQGGSQ